MPPRRSGSEPAMPLVHVGTGEARAVLPVAVLAAAVRAEHVVGEGPHGGVGELGVAVEVVDVAGVRGHRRTEAGTLGEEPRLVPLQPLTTGAPVLVGAAELQLLAAEHLERRDGDPLGLAGERHLDVVAAARGWGEWDRAESGGERALAVGRGVPQFVLVVVDHLGVEAARGIEVIAASGAGS